MSHLVADEVNQLYRDLSGKLITSLVSYFNLSNLALAEDIVQETFVSALQDWTTKGMPDNPQAWLFRVCKNKALNALAKASTKVVTGTLSDGAEAAIDHAFLDHEIRDNQLRLLFATCHPDISPKARIILTLKTLAGFNLEEIARGLAMQPEAVKKTLTRTREYIRTNNMPLHVPFRMQSIERLDTVHQVLYLIFNEGYRATSGEDAIRHDLCLQSMRLTRAIIDEQSIATTDTYALFALMHFNVARLDARLDTTGQLVELAKQDRARWDQTIIRQGIHYFNKVAKDKLSVLGLEAAIASLHATAPSFEETNWNAIVQLYQQRLELGDSSFIRLNQLIATFFAGNKREAIEALKTLTDLQNLAVYHCALATFYKESGDYPKATDHFLEALAKTRLDAERKTIEQRLAELTKNQLPLK